MLNPREKSASVVGLDEASTLLSREPVRWMLYALSLAGDSCCASDLGRLLGYERDGISRYLKPLKALRLVLEAEGDPVRKRLSLGSNVTVSRGPRLVEITIRVPNRRDASIVRFELEPRTEAQFAEFAELISKATTDQ